MGFHYLPPERVKMGCCRLPPDRVKLTVDSKKEIKSMVKMGQGSRWASVIYPLKESKWGFCCLTPDRVKLAVNSKKETNSRVRMGKESIWAKGQDGLLLFTPWKSQYGTKVIMSCWFLPPDRVKLIVNSRVNMGCCCLPPDWVKLTVNSKKETNSRVKMGKESKWAKGQDGLLFFTPWQSQTSSE